MVASQQKGRGTVPDIDQRFYNRLRLGSERAVNASACTRKGAEKSVTVVRICCRVVGLYLDLQFAGVSARDTDKSRYDAVSNSGVERFLGSDKVGTFPKHSIGLAAFLRFFWVYKYGCSEHS